LDKVSTTCGSGWVHTIQDPKVDHQTHPLPQVVLTLSKQKR